MSLIIYKNFNIMIKITFMEGLAIAIKLNNLLRYILI